jgi:hypothetical protein
VPTQRKAPRALADEDSFEFVVPDNSNVSTVPVPAVAASFGAANGAGTFRPKPAPQRRTGASAAAAYAAPRSRQAAVSGRPRSASLADQPPAGADEAQARDVFQLSPTDDDVAAPSVEAVGTSQSLGAPSRGLQSSAMQVVEIASAIAGATMTRVLDNTGDVSWELDQMPRDAIHPGGATSSPSASPWQRRTIPIEGFWTKNGLGQRTYANFEVSFSYNGASVGYVEVSTTQADDAWTWGLTVKETMTQDPQPYRDRTTGNALAALKLRFHYRFDHSPASDEIAIQDLVLFGNGEHSFSERWTQS